MQQHLNAGFQGLHSTRRLLNRQRLLLGRFYKGLTVPSTYDAARPKEGGSKCCDAAKVIQSWDEPRSLQTHAASEAHRSGRETVGVR
jgi:hypothetical protein